MALKYLLVTYIQRAHWKLANIGQKEAKTLKEQNSDIGMPRSHNSSEGKQSTVHAPLTSGKGSDHLGSGVCALLAQNLSGSSVPSASKKGGDVENTPL